MFALQLHVDPFDIEFDQTRRQDLEQEKPAKPKKQKKSSTSDDPISPYTPAVDGDEVQVDEELDGENEELDMDEPDEEEQFE